MDTFKFAFHYDPKDQITKPFSSIPKTIQQLIIIEEEEKKEKGFEANPLDRAYHRLLNIEQVGGLYDNQNIVDSPVIKKLLWEDKE